MVTPALLRSLTAGRRDRLVTLEQPVISRDSATGAPARSWSTVAQEWAEVLESATAGSSLGSGEDRALNVATYARPTRVRIPYRGDVATDWRVNLGDGRYLEIIGTAVLGRRDGLELACREWAHG